jgi:hypothetical protein
MTRYVDNPINCEAVKDFRDAIADFQFDKVSLEIVIQLLESKDAPHEIKMSVLELVVERLEEDIEPLDTPIQSYEQITSPKPKDIVSSSDFLIDEPFVDKHKSDVEQLQSGSDIEDTNGKLIHVKMLKEYPENQQEDHIFFDPVANYIDFFFSATVQTCFFCKNPRYHPLPVHIAALIFIKHDEEAQSRDQLLGWLHWHFSIT